MPIGATRAKKPLANRLNDVDNLAVKLEGKLKITNGTGTRFRKPAGPPVKTKDEQKADAMRMINASLQMLSSMVEKSDLSPTTVSNAVQGHAALNTLRKLEPNLLNAERAALSMASKLLALNLHEDAFGVLLDARYHLPKHFGVLEAERSKVDPLALLQLPDPPEPLGPNDPAIVLMPNFLSLALSIACRMVSSRADAFKILIEILESDRYLSWFRHLLPLPTKTKDSLYKRIYSILTASHPDFKATAAQTLRLRCSALRVLLQSSELDNASFWDQCLKFAVSYARRSDGTETEEEKTKIILGYLRRIELAAGPQRQVGRGWVAFCEYSLTLSERMKDVEMINVCVNKIKIAASSSHDILDSAALLSASLAQLTMSLESKGLDHDSLRKLVTTVLSNLHSLESQAEPLIENKTRRSIDKSRKAVLKAISSARADICEVLIDLAEAITTFMERLLQRSHKTQDKTDTTVSVLDSLFQLAIISSQTNESSGYDKAYDFLVRGETIVNEFVVCSADDKLSRANFIRCLSGAFANIAGQLYKAERHGFAIRFLVQGCPLSGTATEVFREILTRDASLLSQKDLETWTAHRNQVYRRWELLGICYIKTGNRGEARNAFVNGIYSFPFDTSSQSSRPEHALPQTLLTAVDRLTHLSVFELHMDPSETSLRSVLESNDVPPKAIASILKQQFFSLRDRGRPLVIETSGRILLDLLAQYESSCNPILRAQILVLLLEHEYFIVTVETSMNSAQKRLHEVNQLLSDKSPIGEDSALAQLRPYIRAHASLWHVLHAHRVGLPSRAFMEIVESSLENLQNLSKIEKQSAGGETINNRLGGRARSRLAKTTSRAPKAKSSSNSKSSRQPPKTPRGAHVEESPEIEKTTGAPTTLNEIVKLSQSSVAQLSLVVAELLGLHGLLLQRIRILHSIRLRLVDPGSMYTDESFIQASALLAADLSVLGKVSLSKDILSPVVDSITKNGLQTVASVNCLLQYAEVMSITDDLETACSTYIEASQIADAILSDDAERSLPSVARIRLRVKILERVAQAANTFAAIQDAKENGVLSLKARLQCLRVLNRATDTLIRLNPASEQELTKDADDPFAMTDLKTALPNASKKSPERSETKTVPAVTQVDGLEWRISAALFQAQLNLSETYAIRGSAREAEYFIIQAEELGRALGSDAMVSRALLQRSEIQLALGLSREAQDSLSEAANLLNDSSCLDMVEVDRASGDQLIRIAQESKAESKLADALQVLSQLEQSFTAVNNHLLPNKKSKDGDFFAPLQRGKVLRQLVWLSRDELGEKYERLLDELLGLPQVPLIEVQVNSMLGRLALYDLHERFRSDMSLSSLIESTIALPLTMSSGTSSLYNPPQDIMDALSQAEEHYTSDLSRFADRDRVSNVRASAVSAALISVYQTPTSASQESAAAFVSRLLDLATSLTLRRELADAITFKFLDMNDKDDTRWPSEPVDDPEPSSRPRSRSRSKTKVSGKRGLFAEITDDEDPEHPNDQFKAYWSYVQAKHRNLPFIESEESVPQVDSLPDNWTVVSITLTEDKAALLISRQRPKVEPVIFYVPLKGRREEDAEDYFSFDSAIGELQDILQQSQDSTKQAAQIKSNDKEGKADWWAQRKALDVRLKELLENIEFCWLGAFKTILSEPRDIPNVLLANLRSRFEKVFRRILGSHEKKAQKAKLRLETPILSLFASLSPTCKNEELEDIVYFVLDLYHFHGIPIALAEVDIDIVVVDLRGALEDYHAKAKGKAEPVKDSHTFLVLDRHVQSIPWESIPILRGRSVSRVPGIGFITDRLAMARYQRGMPLDSTVVDVSESMPPEELATASIDVDPSNGLFVLNPSGDLIGTEKRFKDWADGMKKVGWDGVVGRPPSEQQMLDALQRRDLLIYFGHSGAEQYIRSHRIRHLPRCAVTMLWGCSSGLLRPQGDFDPAGTPNNYMLAGCPALVANLWDVTDRDIDKFAMEVFDRIGLDGSSLAKQKLKGKKTGKGKERVKVSVCEAVGKSRDVCKLKYLTGAAVVVYGIPYYL